MKNIVCMTVFVTFFVTMGCSSKSDNRLRVIEKYTRNLRYKSDTIVFRERNVFTRKINYMGFNKNYYGLYTQSGDTIYLQYHNSKQPKDELSMVLRKNNSIFILEIYDKIKDKYSNYSADKLDEIAKKDLMTKDTAKIEYLNIK